MPKAERIPTECGIFFGMPFERYVRLDAYNFHSLKHAQRSMEMFKHHWDHGDEPDREALLFGRVFHTWLFEPQHASRRYCQTPAVYPLVESAESGYTVRPVPPKDGLHWCVRKKNSRKPEETWGVALAYDEEADDWQPVGDAPEGSYRLILKPWFAASTYCTHWKRDRELQGVQIITQDMGMSAREMADRLRALPWVAEHLDGADCEVVAVWDDPQTGLRCKLRLDAVHCQERLVTILDGKKTHKSAAYDSFPWEVHRYSYATQAAMYVEGLQHAYRALGEDRDVASFVFLVAEDMPPYTPAVYGIGCHEVLRSGAWYGYGAQQWHGWLQQVKLALDNDWWSGHNNAAPGSVTGVEELPIPDGLKDRIVPLAWNITGD